MRNLKRFIAFLTLFLFTSILLLAQPDLRHPESISEVAIILNTVGDEMNEDYISTLKTLKEIGYTYIEGGYYGESAEDYRKLLNDMGLKSLAFGSDLNQLLKDPQPTIETVKALGAHYVVCYFPWHFGWENRLEDINLDNALQAAKDLNKIGKAVKEAGLQFVWHNHELEFKKLENGKTAFEVIMDNTSPEFVSAELDIYWTTKGGGDPIEQINNYPGRIPLLHFKDMDKSEEKSFACVGEGIIDFQPVVEAAKKNGVKHLIVEHDDPEDGIHCAQIGFTTIQSILTKKQ